MEAVQKENGWRNQRLAREGRDCMNEMATFWLRRRYPIPTPGRDERGRIAVILYLGSDYK